MEEARKKAEQGSEKPIEKYVEKSVENVDNDVVEAVQLTIKPAVTKKPRKKAVNYYLTTDLIEEIEKKAKKFNKKGSHLVEELLSQIIYDL